MNSKSKSKQMRIASTSRFASDHRIPYFRTPGNLAMHENWEFALSQARGRYVYVLEDKVRLVPTALSILRNHFKLLGDVVLSFDLRFAQDEFPPTFTPGPVSMISKESVLEMFHRLEQRFFQVLPKGIDSCAPRRLIERIKRRSPNADFFSYICPDYTSGFKLLSHLDHYYRIEDPLAYIPHNWMKGGQFSNGHQSYLRSKGWDDFLDAQPIVRSMIRRAGPVPTEYLWINVVLSDYLRTFSGIGAYVDAACYFAFCKYLVILGRRIGALMTIQEEDINKALRSETYAFRAKVNFILFKMCAKAGVGLLKRKAGL